MHRSPRRGHPEGRGRRLLHSDGVKIVIAVVLGALLLAALTNIFNGTVIPRITQEIQRLFN